MDSLTLYLITRMDYIQAFLSIVAFSLALVIIVGLIVSHCESTLNKYKSDLIKGSIITIVLILLVIMIPSKKDLAIMYFVPKVTTAESLDVIDKLPKALQKQLIEYLEN